MILVRCLMVLTLSSGSAFADPESQVADYEEGEEAQPLDQEEWTPNYDEETGEVDMENEGSSIPDSLESDNSGEGEVDVDLFESDDTKLAKNEKKPVMPTKAATKKTAMPTKNTKGPAVAAKAPIQKPTTSTKPSAKKVEAAPVKKPEMNSKVAKVNTKVASPAMDSATAMKKVQAALNTKGEKLTVDGKSGPQTKAAIKRFQSKNSLPSTGKADSKTMAKLGIK